FLATSAKPLIPREEHDSTGTLNSRQSCLGVVRASRRLPSVTCNFPVGIASNLRSNLYFLKAMKPVGKVGVSVLSLVLLAMPIIACVMPAFAMTGAERDCCKRMAQECGKGMAKSHSCCQTATVSDHPPAIKSSSDVNSRHLAVVLAHALPPIPTITTMPESGSSPWSAPIHSPPVSPPVTSSVLRI